MKEKERKKIQGGKVESAFSTLPSSLSLIVYFVIDDWHLISCDQKKSSKSSVNALLNCTDIIYTIPKVGC